MVNQHTPAQKTFCAPPSPASQPAAALALVALARWCGFLLSGYFTECPPPAAYPHQPHATQPPVQRGVVVCLKLKIACINNIYSNANFSLSGNSTSECQWCSVQYQAVTLGVHCQRFEWPECRCEWRWREWRWREWRKSQWWWCGWCKAVPVYWCVTVYVHVQVT